MTECLDVAPGAALRSRSVPALMPLQVKQLVQLAVVERCMKCGVTSIKIPADAEEQDERRDSALPVIFALFWSVIVLLPAVVAPPTVSLLHVPLRTCLG